MSWFTVLFVGGASVSPVALSVRVSVLSRSVLLERPLILPIYFSSPAFNFAAMSSYLNFCFLYHIRFSAFFGEHGSIADGLAETFYFYSQNLPTVALLLPRAGLCLALLFAFSSPDPDVVALADAGLSRRDGTFFRASDGTLTDYARGVLIANAAWTAWRVLVLLISWYVFFSTLPCFGSTTVLVPGSDSGYSAGRAAQACAARGTAGKKRTQRKLPRRLTTTSPTSTRSRGRGRSARSSV